MTLQLLQQGPSSAHCMHWFVYSVHLQNMFILKSLCILPSLGAQYFEHDLSSQTVVIFFGLI